MSFIFILLRSKFEIRVIKKIVLKTRLFLRRKEVSLQNYPLQCTVLFWIARDLEGLDVSVFISSDVIPEFKSLKPLLQSMPDFCVIVLYNETWKFIILFQISRSYSWYPPQPQFCLFLRPKIVLLIYSWFTTASKDYNNNKLFIPCK